MKKLIGIIFVIGLVMFIPIAASADSLVNGKNFELVFAKSGGKNYVVPITNNNESYEYQIGIDNNLDGKVDKTLDPNKDLTDKVKYFEMDSSKINIYINNQKVNMDIDFSMLNDITDYLKAFKTDKSETVETFNKDNKLTVLRLKGQVNEEKIVYTPYFGESAITLPMQINEYGQFSTASFISSGTRTVSEKQSKYIKSNKITTETLSLKYLKDIPMPETDPRN
ncbi:MAG: hypothetical protein ACK5HR_00030, partial [Mycoplasmatales bacterium]